MILQRNRSDLYFYDLFDHYAIENSIAVAVDRRIPFTARFMVSEIAFTIAGWIHEVNV